VTVGDPQRCNSLAAIEVTAVQGCIKRLDFALVGLAGDANRDNEATASRLTGFGMADAKSRSVVLVEGESDGAAVQTLARRLGHDLDAEGVSVVAMGGYGNLGRFLERYGPSGLGVRLAGLYDSPEECHFRRGLARAGFGSDLTRADLEALGFYACDVNLEDELTRAMGPAAMEELLEAQGELGASAARPGARPRALRRTSNRSGFRKRLVILGRPPPLSSRPRARRERR
jgi:hypothetical protein